MGQKKNKRTMKKKIRRVISLCIFLTILQFGGVVILLSAFIFKFGALAICGYHGAALGQSMSSPYFLKQIGIKGLEDFNSTSPNAKQWIDSLKKSESVSLNDITFQVPFINEHKNINEIKIKNIKIKKPADLADLKNKIYTVIELNNKIIYRSDNLNKFLYHKTLENCYLNDKDSALRRLYDFITNTQTVYYLYDSKNSVIGSVTTSIDHDILLGIFIFTVIAVIVIGLLSLIISNIVSRLFTISISNPLIQLDQKIRAIANGNFENNMNTEIVLKRPLREIEALANSTTLVMNKMSDYNNQLKSQKVMLENQNYELEAQNEELIQSRNKLQEAQSMLVQKENMASIGQLTAAINHEINTPLGAVSSNAQLCDMLIKALEQNDTVRSSEDLHGIIEQLKEINNTSIMACKRITEIIRSLKTFSKIDQAEFQEADINEGIRSVLVLTSNLWKQKVTIHEEYQDIPLVKCFPGLLNQVFMNIIVNAIQSIAVKGDIFIKTYCDDSNAYFNIRDTGCGIKKEYLPHIFETGFTTKKAGDGMGLGLAICKNIIKQHNGDISVESEPDTGTGFTVRIPLDARKTEET